MPALATVDAESDTALFIKKAKCGWVGEPENIDWLSEKMKFISNLSLSELENIGQRGRQFGYLHFSKKEGVRKLADLILEHPETA